VSRRFGENINDTKKESRVEEWRRWQRFPKRQPTEEEVKVK
jgi:hypothetical protein